MGAQDHEQFNHIESSQPKTNDSQHLTPQRNGPSNAGNESMPEPTLQGDTPAEHVFQVAIKLPHHPNQIQIMVSTQEQVQDLRQTIMETPGAMQYSCFHLELDKQRINDYIELSELTGLAADSEFTLVEDAYTEREARLHLSRVREMVGMNVEKPDQPYGVSAGAALHDTVCSLDPSLQEGNQAGTTQSAENKLSDYAFDSQPSLGTIVTSIHQPKPRIVKSLTVSPWNPPPAHLRQLGHLLYLQLTTNEGEQFQITSAITGFSASKSSNGKFDPFARAVPKDAHAHSLLTLISTLSASFETAFAQYLHESRKRDPLVSFQVINAIPASPWLVSPDTRLLSNHHPDLARTQESYIMPSPDGMENLRDWNDELQSTRELPRQTVQERVFRERLMGKIYAEFTDAAVRGALLVVKGEVPPLNPTESPDAQIFVYNNVFYSFGADGVGTFATDGGDEAARVAVAKDVEGVKAVNQLDVKGLVTAGTIIVDYLGKRIVAQTIVPGIFKQREPDEHQVDYGGVEGRDVVADNPAFVPTFSQVSKLLKVKPHPVWDKEGKRHDLEGSVETKGLLGTDGRKYILDLYRLAPLDILWLESCSSDASSGEINGTLAYPHRMTVLRPELVDSYWRLKLSEYVKARLKKQENAGNSGEQTQSSTEDDGREVKPGESEEDPVGVAEQTGISTGKEISPNAVEQLDETQERIDVSAFSLAFNPDVFSGQQPQSDEEKAGMLKDEAEVKSLCAHLHDQVLPGLLHDLNEAEVGFPMDGSSLSSLLHKRGINIRYLGKVATLADDGARGRALKVLALQEMIARGFKHEAFRYLKSLPPVFVRSCVSHLLNCFLGCQLNASPEATFDMELAAFYPTANLGFTKSTPDQLTLHIREQVRRRFRYELPEELVSSDQRIQILRSVCLKLGIQLVAREYQFQPNTTSDEPQETSTTNGAITESTPNGSKPANGSSKKKKKGPSRAAVSAAPPSNPRPPTTFTPDDVVNMVPVVKESSPKSVLAEEALEAGKISLMQNHKEMGQELLLESLTLHEQIYGVFHPEVARVYHQLATLYFQLDEKAAAAELAHKAVIISERTLGVDASETILSYLNLALFEHGNRNTTMAVACVRHALESWKIVYGKGHPDIVTTLNNAAVMLQHLHKYSQSRAWFEKSLQLSQENAGSSSVSTATVLFQLAQALVLDGDHKGAVQRMREAYSIFLSKLGPQDGNTKESEKWLEQLTQNAVSMAKHALHAKDVQARRMRGVLFNSRTSRLAGDFQPRLNDGQGHVMNGTGTQNTSVLDSRNIDELLRYIEGGVDVTKTPPSKKRLRKSNPRRRGGPSVGSAA